MSRSAEPLLPRGEGGGPKGVRKDARPSGRAIGSPDEGTAPKTRARSAREPSPQPLSRRRGETRLDRSAEAVLAELFTAAKAAQANAYAPYSRFHVGAALRSESGAIYGGCNVENAAYPQGSCAETGAISAMALAGDRRIVEILVVGDGESLCTPCGGCRQRIREFAGPETAIHIAGPEGVRATFTLAELLPQSFGPDHVRTA
jgi:cytidine deaminase